MSSMVVSSTLKDDIDELIETSIRRTSADPSHEPHQRPRPSIPPAEPACQGPPFSRILGSRQDCARDSIELVQTVLDTGDVTQSWSCQEKGSPVGVSMRRI